MTQVIVESFHDDRVFRCEPAHRSVRGEPVAGILSSVPLKLHRQGRSSRGMAKAPAHSREQGIVDIRVQLAKVRAKEAAGLLRAQGPTKPREDSLIILSVGGFEISKLLLHARPVGNLQAQQIAVAEAQKRLCVITVGAGLGGQSYRLPLEHLSIGGLQV